jgi:hypothetical protein
LPSIYSQWLQKDRTFEIAQSSANKFKPAFVTVKASVRGQTRECIFPTDNDNPNVIKSELRSGFVVTGGFLIDKGNVVAILLQRGETYTFVEIFDTTDSAPPGTKFVWSLLS